MLKRHLKPSPEVKVLQQMSDRSVYRMVNLGNYMEVMILENKDSKIASMSFDMCFYPTEFVALSDHQV